jgi:transcription regulator MmyB-like protein
VTAPNTLGEYLRARRELVDPADVGLHVAGVRPARGRTRAGRDLHPDWPKAIGGMIASFRASIGPDADDPRIARLVGELSLASEPFRKLWARHDVRAPAGPALTGPASAAAATGARTRAPRRR